MHKRTKLIGHTEHNQSRGYHGRGQCGERASGMISTSLDWNGQTFTIIGFRDHTNRRGYPAPLVVLEAACKQCGNRFETAVRKAKSLRLSHCRKRCLTCSPPR